MDTPTLKKIIYYLEAYIEDCHEYADQNECTSDTKEVEALVERVREEVNKE